MADLFYSKAPAKVNLVLNVLGKRADGFHEIRTIFQSIALFDVLRFSLIAEGIEVDSDEPSLPGGEGNIVHKAAKALASISKKKCGVNIFIEKNIPQKAGLGGGSSDAAVTLYGLNKLWELNLPESELMEIAAEIGSDVPFFLTGGTALGVGKGEEIYPLPDAPAAILVLGFPEKGISTKDAYERMDKELTEARSPRKIMASVKKIMAGSFLENDLVNDFEKAVLDSDKEILFYRDRLLEAGAKKVLLSGSGSAWFAYAHSKDEAEQIREKILHHSKRWAIIPTMNRDDFFKFITPTSKKENLR
jgi:4-diphosphocytidyl-2-C-methyl-D-erythritol kinase